jgi:peptide/nickel transport system ATP-binding protein
VLEPKFVVADEPVSMLDVSVRASILELLESLVEDLNMAALYISHDLSLIRQMCDRVNVMYLGEIAESGPTEAIVQSPKHPYARALLDAVPVPDPSKEIAEPGLAGEPPDPVDLPTGCNFRPRCPFANEACFEQPAADEWSQGEKRRAACFRVDAVAENPAAVESSSPDVPGEAESGD